MLGTTTASTSPSPLLRRQTRRRARVLALMMLTLAACSDDALTGDQEGEDPASEQSPGKGTMERDGSTPRASLDASTTDNPLMDASTLSDGGLAVDASANDGSNPSSNSDASVVADAADSGTDAGAELPPLTDKCESGSARACGIFVTSSGSEIVLGPYGAAMDVNVGKGFENRVSLLDTDSACASFAAQFGGDRADGDALSDSTGLDLSLYTIYRPARWKEGERYPIVSWGNGTCAKPEGYGALLRYVASHGYIVVAANSRYVGSGTPQKRAIDFAVAAHSDAKSPYYQRVDASRVAAMGHSQGGQATITASGDPRIKTVIVFNGGASAEKPFLAISGDRDIGDPTAAQLEAAIADESKAAFLFFHKVPGRGNADGHLTLMTQPERVTGATVAWLAYLLSGDPASAQWFVGPNCKLCGQEDDFEYGQQGL